MQLHTLFHNTLQNIYPSTEIDAIFYWYIKEKYQIEKHQYILNREIIIMDDAIAADLSLLSQNTPIQHIIGHTYFLDLKIEVNSNVLVPRPETEVMVASLLQDFSFSEMQSPTILEVGTGSGAIALALKDGLSHSHVYATDVSKEALAVAQHNSHQLQIEVEWMIHDILHDSWEVLPCPIDLVVSNPPYIPLSQQNELHPNVVNFDPALALWVPNNDPLLFYRAIARMAAQQLRPDGILYFETHENYHSELIAMLTELQFHNIHAVNDFRNLPRYIWGQKQ